MCFVNVFYSIDASIYALEILKSDQLLLSCQFQDKATFKSLDFNQVLWRQTLQIFEFQYILYHNLLMAVSYGDSVLHEGDR